MTYPKTAATQWLSYIVRASAAVLMIAALAGCGGVDSNYPLSSPKTAKPDHSLEGLWKGEGSKDGANYAYVVYGDHGVGTIQHFGKASSSAGNNELVSYHSPDTYIFFVTETPKGKYINYLYEDPKETSDKNPTMVAAASRMVGKPETFAFMKYHFNWLGKLVCDEPDVNIIGKAVESGKLKGKVDYDNKHKISAVHLTDTSAYVLSVFETTPGAFTKGTAWAKIGGP
jgi:hypothetical protein